MQFFEIARCDGRHFNQNLHNLIKFTWKQRKMCVEKVVNKTNSTLFASTLHRVTREKCHMKRGILSSMENAF